MDDQRTRELLELGEIEILGQLVESSNETFLVELTHGDDQRWAIYKPELGERPLYDFEPGLYRRERAAYLLSESLGWGIVPLTIIREDGPFGIGSVQRFIETDVAQHYFTLYTDCPESHEDLKRMAVFDVLANNTDRKAGHVLRGLDGRIWGIDHGLCFAEPFKLRTVIWDFAREPIAESLLADIAHLEHEIPSEVADLLTAGEVRAVRERVRVLKLLGRLPADPTGRRFPWPLI